MDKNNFYIAAEIKYQTTFETLLVPVGQNMGFERVPGDIILYRHVGLNCPLKVIIQITPDGKVVWWKSEWENVMGCGYWHFLFAEQEQQEVNEKQKETLRKIQDEGVVFGDYWMPGTLGYPVMKMLDPKEAYAALMMHN